MRKLLLLAIFLFNFNALAENLVKVAVIDTGLNLKYSKYANLCHGEHKDFTGEGLNDIHGHGTNIVGLITNTAQTKNYCIVLIKAYGYKEGKTEYITQALEYAYQIKVNIINLSGGGFGIRPNEQTIVKKILDAKITLIVSAGNNQTNFNLNCNYYPACYDKRIYVVGNNHELSNYGTTVDIFYDGVDKKAFGQTMTGTSQSTAIFTGELLKTLDFYKKRK